MQYLETESSTGHPAEEINRCWDPNFLIQTNRKTPSWRAGLVRVCASSGGKRFISTQGFLFFFVIVFSKFLLLFPTSCSIQYCIYIWIQCHPPEKKHHFFLSRVFLFLAKATVVTLCGFLFILCWFAGPPLDAQHRTAGFQDLRVFLIFFMDKNKQTTKTWIHLSKQVCRKCWKLSNTLATVGQYTNSVVKSTDFSIFHSYHESSSCFHLRWNLASSSTCLAEQFTWRITATDAKFFLLGVGHK